MATRIRKFSGCIRAYRINPDGSRLGHTFDIGNVATLGLDIKKELVKVISNNCVSAGATLESRDKPAVASGTLICEEWQPEMVLEALGATKSSQTITASTLADEDITLVGFDYWTEIGTKRLDNVVVKDSTGAVTLVEGVDYTIDPYMGIIKPVKGSATLATGTEHVLVSADGLADDTPEYTLGAGTSGLFAITGHLLDSWSNKNGELFLVKVRLVLNNEINFVAGTDDDLTNLEFEVSPEVIPGVAGFGTFSGEVLG